jgi:hypothetical protein
VKLNKKERWTSTRTLFHVLFLDLSSFGRGLMGSEDQDGLETARIKAPILPKSKPIILGPSYSDDEDGGEETTAPLPTRDADGTIQFEGRWAGVFTPNVSPEEMFEGGAFGGGFFVWVKSSPFPLWALSWGWGGEVFGYVKILGFGGVYAISMWMFLDVGSVVGLDVDIDGIVTVNLDGTLDGKWVETSTGTSMWEAVDGDNAAAKNILVAPVNIDVSPYRSEYQ